jgi:hypothetical protein
LKYRAYLDRGSSRGVEKHSRFAEEGPVLQGGEDGGFVSGDHVDQAALEEEHVMPWVIL